MRKWVSFNLAPIIYKSDYDCDYEKGDKSDFAGGEGEVSSGQLVAPRRRKGATVATKSCAVRRNAATDLMFNLFDSNQLLNF